MLMYVSGDDIGLVRREPFTGAQDSYQEGAAAVTLVESQAAPPSNIIGDCYAPAHWDGARAQSNDSSSEWLSWDQRVSRLLLPGAKLYSCSSYCAPMTSISKLLASKWLRCGSLKRGNRKSDSPIRISAGPQHSQSPSYVN